MIRPLGFIDTSSLTARFVVKYRDRMENGILPLRAMGDDGEVNDLPILKEFNSARALLSRFKGIATPFLNGTPATLGKAWIETLPGNHGTPWTVEEDDYAQAHARTRTCLIGVPEAFSFSGAEKIQMMVGVVNLVEQRKLCSEVNFSAYPRVHLIIDVARPPDAES